MRVSDDFLPIDIIEREKQWVVRIGFHIEATFVEYQAAERFVYNLIVWYRPACLNRYNRAGLLYRMETFLGRTKVPQFDLR